MIRVEPVRTTLNRMAGRGLLQSLRQDRKTCFGLTPHAAKVLTDGGDRAWRTTGAVNRDWDGRWTVVGFSLPEAWSRERHDLRSRLLRAGFGPPQDGLRVAPARVDVREMVAGLGTEPCLRVLRAEAESPTDVREVLEQAFDVPAIGARYWAFLECWDRTDPLPAAETVSRGLAGRRERPAARVAARLLGALTLD